MTIHSHADLFTRARVHGELHPESQALLEEMATAIRNLSGVIVATARVRRRPWWSQR